MNAIDIPALIGIVTVVATIIAGGINLRAARKKGIKEFNERRKSRNEKN